ncbi:class I SAM-dependent methyltransferase [Microvirga sp. TS319]|uniref:class I SAM-dependent methyltransferase n=1 Tax=Microvirga sp. TS319 TaxID=3241165 RepID=UPI003519F9DA
MLWARSAPHGPFDAATCLLTLHFVPAEERLRTLSEVGKRLKPGAPFGVAHHSSPQEEKALWLGRYAAFASFSGIPAEKAEAAAAEIGHRLPVLSPDQDEALMREAGFSDVSLICAGFTVRGWVACRR